MKWYVGRYIDFDHLYGYQCMDVAVDYVWWLTRSTYHLKGNARDSVNPRINKLPDGLKVYVNTPEFMPQKGDIMVYSSGYFDNAYGHVAIVYDTITLQSCTVLEQNWDGKAKSPCRLRKEVGYNGVTHFIRPV